MSNLINVGGYKVRLVPSSFDRYFSRLVRSLVHVINRHYFSLTIHGSDNLPEPPFLIAPIHRSNLDTVLITSVTNKPLRYIGKDSLWKFRLPGEVLTALGGFPVNRDLADREAVDVCVSLLNAGQALVLFPEGTRSSGPTVGEIHYGAAYIALKSKVPIVPVGIAGSAQAWPKGTKIPRPRKCAIVVGVPINDAVIQDPTVKRVPRSKVKELTVKLEKHLQQVLDQANAELP